VHPFILSCVLLKHSSQNQPIVQKTIALFLVSLFALTQYMRQLSYLECKVYNALNPKTVRCDCESKTGVGKVINAPAHPPAAHIHIVLDDFFVTHALSLSAGHLQDVVSLLFPLSNESLCKGVRFPPWQPPGC